LKSANNLTFASHSLSAACGGGVCGRLGQITPSALNFSVNLGYCQVYSSLSAAPRLMENFQVKTWDISIKPKIWCIFREKTRDIFQREFKSAKNNLFSPQPNPGINPITNGLTNQIREPVQFFTKLTASLNCRVTFSSDRIQQTFLLLECVFVFD